MALPTLTNGWVDLHDNTANFLPGQTRYGLVVDLGKSAFRMNINFEKMPETTLLGKYSKPGLNKAQKQNLYDAFEMYVNTSMAQDKLCFIAAGQRNRNPGKRNYKLSYDYDCFAILDLRNGTHNPIVNLWWDGQVHVLQEKWYAPSTSNYSIESRIDL